MKHYGDITKIDGRKVPAVDIITGGSPCQDLSVAGKRAGLSGERSGLFAEQVRVIKEMREQVGADNIRRPRYMVWENVFGAFSSNGGEDFRIVLEEICKIADETAAVPRLEGGAKWTSAGCVLGDTYSVCWRVHDAQYWGVPQRRKRLCVVADFDGHTAGEILFAPELRREADYTEAFKTKSDTGSESGQEILFERESVRGDIAACGEPWKTVTAVTQSSVRTSGGNGTVAFHLTQTPVNGDVAPCLSSGNPNSGQCMCGVFQPTYCIQGNCIDRADTAGCNGKGLTEEVSYTLNAVEQHAVFDARGNGDGETVPTITGDHENRITDYTAVCIGNGQADQTDMHDQQAVITFSKQRSDEFKQSEQASNISARDYKSASDLVCGSFYPQRKAENQCYRNDNISNTLVNGTNPGFQNGVVTAVDCRNGRETDINGTLQAKDSGGTSYNLNNVCRTSVVRRLTPLECERLMGFPDHYTDIGDWTDSKGKKHKSADSPRYKALGNSIALPFWEWLMKRIAKHLPENSTMASLFDGIGGFPLVSIRAGITPVWASEVEEFCIAVTKKHFGEN